MKLGQCRLRIVNYFDDLVNDVDLKAEQALADEFEIEEVNERREAIISRVRQVQDHNLAHLDKTYKEEEFERLTDIEIDTRLFKKFCFVINVSGRNKYTCSVDRLFGQFVVVDRFVREDTLSAFRELLQGKLAENSLLFEMEKEENMFIKIESGVFRANNLMMECTTRELFKLDRVESKGIIKSVKDPARELFENIQRVDFIIKSFSQEYIESLRLIARNADYVHLFCHDHKFDASIIAGLSEIKIKSLRLSVNKLTKKDVTHDDNGSPVAEPFQLSDLLLPLVHLEELELGSWTGRDLASEQYPTIKFDRLKKLTLDTVRVDVEFIECFENLNELVLERVPKTAQAIKKNLKLMQQLRSVEIRDCSLQEIEAESFQGLKSITSLHLTSNRINKIHENAFVHLTNLNRLKLCYNVLGKLNASALNGLTSLTYLNLSSCRIALLDENLFNGLRSLTSLDLSYNQLTTICRSISGLSQLKQLNLKQNSVETLDGHIFEQLVELEALYLSNNKIKSVEPDLFQGLVKLQHLSLKGNQLSSIEADAFHGLSSLNFLDLSHNMISSFEPTAFKPLDATLEYLYLNGNQLQQIDSSLFHLQSLEELHLASNRIEKLELRGLENLVELDLSGNMMSDICQDSWSIIRPSSLSYLDLSCNKITRIESNFFSLFPQLEQLYLNVNQITELKKETFWCLENLLHLDLSKNKIEFLHPELFKSQRCLKTLSIGENALQEINCDTFSANLVSLTILDLSYNQITSSQIDSFAHLARLNKRNLML